MLSDTGKGCFKQASSSLGLHFKSRVLFILNTRKKHRVWMRGWLALLSKLEDLWEGQKKILERDLVFFFPFSVPTRHKDVTSRRKGHDFDFEMCSF